MVLSLVAALRDRGRGGRHRMKLPRGAVAIATILLAVLLSTRSVEAAPLRDCGTPGAQPVHNSSGYCIAPSMWS